MKPVGLCESASSPQVSSGIAGVSIGLFDAAGEPVMAASKACDRDSDRRSGSITGGMGWKLFMERSRMVGRPSGEVARGTGEEGRWLDVTSYWTSLRPDVCLRSEWPKGACVEDGDAPSDEIEVERRSSNAGAAGSGPLRTTGGGGVL